MENPRFIEGDLGTHFIERETTLMGDMMRIMEEEKPLEGRLPQLFEEKKRIAAIAAVAAITQMRGHVQPKQYGRSEVLLLEKKWNRGG